MPSATTSSDFARAVNVQCRVLGALLMRELHTRFGRDNIGYLWLLIEPSLLAIGITAARIFEGVHYQGQINVPQFVISGYVPYMMFRANVNRATATVLANRGLLYHRQVTLVDLVVSRCLLEFISTLGTFVFMMYAVELLGLAPGIHSLMPIVFGMALLFWYTTGFAMIVSAASEVFPVVERFVHPYTYLTLPVSGMFFLNEWIPSTLRKYLMLFPLPDIIEFIRTGIFEPFSSEYTNIIYVLIVCALQTIVGYSALSVIRRKIHL